MPSLKLVTLNIGRGFTGMNRIFGFLARGWFDIACLQDVRESHLSELAKIFPGAQYFAPMTKHLFGGKRESVGIGIFSRTHPFVSTSACAYVGNVLPVLDLEGVNVDAHDNASPHDLDLVRKTESRLVIFTEVSVGGKVFHFATTHGVWVPGGKTDDHQLKCMTKCAEIIDRANWRNPRLVFAGDLNAARGGEIYKILFMGETDRRDCVPSSITNTVDWVMRGKQGPDLVVDYISSYDNLNRVEVGNVETHFGVSDHAALTATVSSI